MNEQIEGAIQTLERGLTNYLERHGEQDQQLIALRVAIKGALSILRAPVVAPAVSGSEATLRRAEALNWFRDGYKEARVSNIPYDDISETAVLYAFDSKWASRNDR